LRLGGYLFLNRKRAKKVSTFSMTSSGFVCALLEVTNKKAAQVALRCSTYV
jgi:hypothetical protein